METLLALAIGVVIATSVYLFLSRDLPRMLLGFVLLGNGVNLAILLAGRIGPMAPALIADGADTLAAHTANPLPQALILTAIVIGFGLTAFALMLTLQAWRRFGTLDAESLDDAERIDAATLPERFGAGSAMPNGGGHDSPPAGPRAGRADGQAATAMGRELFAPAAAGLPREDAR